MACYGGCIGGGGQPAFPTKEILMKRMEAVVKVDTTLPIRKSHLNQSVINFYKENVGEYGSQKAHELLHTKYVDRSNEYI
ncbi:MAG: iron hydrogenase small subunit [archaeon]